MATPITTGGFGSAEDPAEGILPIPGTSSPPPSYISTGGAGASVPPPQATVGTSTSQAIAAGNQAFGQLPNYGGDLSGIGSNVSSEIAGQLPDSVIQQLQQGAAERGVSTGSPGGPNSNASYLQALGLNSLNLTNLGQSNFDTALQNLPGSAISQNPSFYVTPALQQQAATTNATINAQANNQNAALNAAQAGLAAGSGTNPTAAPVGGATTFGALPPTPNTSKTASAAPSAPYYAQPQTGWGNIGNDNNPVVSPASPANPMDSVQNIINNYASVVDPANESSGIYMGANYSNEGTTDTNSGENDYSYATAGGGGDDYFGGYDDGDE